MNHFRAIRSTTLEDGRIVTNYLAHSPGYDYRTSHQERGSYSPKYDYWTSYQERAYVFQDLEEARKALLALQRQDTQTIKWEYKIQTL